MLNASAGCPLFFNGQMGSHSAELQLMLHSWLQKPVVKLRDDA